MLNGFRKVIFIFIISSSAFGHELMGWTIETSKSDVIAPISMGKFNGINIVNNEYELLCLSKDYAPVSIRSVKERIKKLDGDLKTLKVIKTKKRVVFRFQTSDKQLHYFSTTGGYLQVNAKFNNSNKKLNQIYGMIK